jgi:hypothetical protein
MPPDPSSEPNETISRFEKVLVALAGAGVDYAVVGGLAFGAKHHHLCPGKTSTLTRTSQMGMMKNYLLKVLEHCSVEQFGQNAIEWAIITGRVHLGYSLEHDVQLIMLRYDEIIEAYRASLAQSEEKHGQTPAPMKRARHRAAGKAERSHTQSKREHAA